MSDYGWVIEGAWSHVQSPDYWVGSSAWSQDHNRALRFARKQDAEQAAAMMLDGVKVRICEHAWTRDRTNPPQGWAPIDTLRDETRKVLLRDARDHYWVASLDTWSQKNAFPPTEWKSL